MYVYKQPEPGLYTVGFYEPNGAWMPESDHQSTAAAAERVHYLNGARAVSRTLDEALNSGDGSYRP